MPKPTDIIIGVTIAGLGALAAVAKGIDVANSWVTSREGPSHPMYRSNADLDASSASKVRPKFLR